MIKNSNQILNIFTIDEIQFLVKFLNKLPDSHNSGREFFAYTNGFTQKDFVYPAIHKLVIKKIETVLDKKINLLCGMLLKEEKPWLIHSDYIKGDDNPHLAIVIPLNTEELNTHTIIFNEECLDKFENFILNNNKLENNASNLYNNLCSHESIEHLEYVSLLNAYKWHPGSIIYWDRKLLHCSDNFLQNGISQKTALVIFTTN
jgi:hypothetical protein